LDNWAPEARVLEVEPPAAGDNGGLKAKPPAAEEKFAILRLNYSRFCVFLDRFLTIL